MKFSDRTRAMNAPQAEVPVRTPHRKAAPAEPADDGWTQETIKAAIVRWRDIHAQWPNWECWTPGTPDFHRGRFGWSGKYPEGPVVLREYGSWAKACRAAGRW